MLVQTPRFDLRDLLEADRASFTAYQMDPRYRQLYGYDDFHDHRANQLFDLFVAWQKETPRENFQVGIFDASADAPGFARPASRTIRPSSVSN